MTVITTNQLGETDLRSIAALAPRCCLPLGEYPDLPEQHLREYLRSTIERVLPISRTFEYRNSDGLARGLLLVQPASYESALLGLAMHRVTDPLILSEDRVERTRIRAALLEALVQWAYQQGEIHLSASVSSTEDDFNDTLNAFCECGFYYVNTLMTFGATGKHLDKYRQLPGEPNDAVIVREARPEDWDTLLSLCERAFSIDRFHMDRALQNRHCAAIYTKAIDNALRGTFADVVFVAEVGGQIAGYYAGRREHLEPVNVWVGHAISSAVVESYRGKGVFRALNRYLMHWFRQECGLAEMGTYINNRPVHQTWISEGMPLVRCRHFVGLYHAG